MSIVLRTHDDSLENIRAAVERWPGNDPVGRAEAYYRLGQRLHDLGQTHQALKAIARSAEEYQSLGDIENESKAERKLAWIWWVEGTYSMALEHAQRAYDLLKDGPETKDFGWALLLLADIRNRGPAADSGLVRHSFEHSLAIAIRTGDGQLERKARLLLAVFQLFNDGEIDRGFDGIQAAVDRARAAGDLPGLCDAYDPLYFALLATSQFKRIPKVLDEWLACAVKGEMRLEEEFVKSLQFEYAWMTGNWKEGAARKDQVELIFENEGILRAEFRFALRRAEMWMDLGDYEKASRLLDPLLARSLMLGDEGYTWSLCAELARLGKESGQVRARRGCPGIEQCIALLRQMAAVKFYYPFDDASDGITSVFYASLSREFQPDLEYARVCLDYVEEQNRLHPSLMKSAAAAEMRGVLLLQRGKIGEAIGYLRRAILDGRQIEGRNPLGEARVLRTLGQTLTACGEREEALKVLGEAWEIVEGLVGQLDEYPDMRASFLRSPLVESLRVESARAAG